MTSDPATLRTIAVICVTKSRTGDYNFRACARARGFRGSTFLVGRIRFAVCAERSRDKTCVFYENFARITFGTH